MRFPIIRSLGFVISLVASALVPSVARADLVAGHVSGGGFRAGKDAFQIISKAKGNPVVVDKVETDKDNDYAVGIPAGFYYAEFRDKGGALWRADIRSDTEPVRQDIVFEKVAPPKS